MSRVKSRGCSDHQVINTVNNPVETHTAAVPRPVATCRRRARALWGRRRWENVGETRRRLEVLRHRSWCARGTVLWSTPWGARGARPEQGWCRPAPGNRAWAGTVVHLLTGQPTEVIHRCGDRVGSIACKLDNRQPGRSEPGRHSELHACKLLTMWITAVENSRIRTCDFRFGARPGCTGGKIHKAEGTAKEHQRGKHCKRVKGPGVQFRPVTADCGRGLRQERAKRRRRPSARRTRRSPGPGPPRGRWPAAGSAAGRGGCRQSRRRSGRR